MLQEWGPKIPYKIPWRNLNINFKLGNCRDRHVKVYLSIFKKDLDKKGWHGPKKFTCVFL